MDNTIPKLIDSTFQNYMYHTLQKCHQYKVNIYTWMFNIIVLILFVSITGVILYFCYKQKLTPDEYKQKMIRDQEYILSKIRYYQNEKIRTQASNITDLPHIYNPNNVDSYIRL
jgi:hypothetical protein